MFYHPDLNWPPRWLAASLSCCRWASVMREEAISESQCSPLPGVSMRMLLRPLRTSVMQSAANVVLSSLLDAEMIANAVGRCVRSLPGSKMMANDEAFGKNDPNYDPDDIQVLESLFIVYGTCIVYCSLSL